MKQKNMNRIKILMINLVFTFSLSGQCGQGESVLLESQYDVNTFLNQYCTEYYGQLTIKDDNDGVDNIISLEPLLGLKTVEGVLEISDNSIENLAGLDSIFRIGSLLLFGNFNIVNLEGLNNLQLTTGDLWISKNDMLLNLVGLNRLNKVGGTLITSLNDNLQNLNGIETLLSCSSVEIRGNQNLSNIEGLQSIDAQEIYANPLNIEDIRIYNNPNLSICNNAFICEVIQIDQLDFRIENNLMDCNSIEEVYNSCITSALKHEEDYTSRIYPNPASNELIVDIQKEGKLTMYTMLGNKILSTTLSKGLNRIDISTFQKGVYFVFYNDKYFDEIYKL